MKQPNAEFLRTVLDSVNDVVYVRDLDMNIVYTNPAAERVTGQSIDDALRKKCYAVFGDKPLTCRFNCPAERVLDRLEATTHTEGNLVDRDGEIRRMRVSISPYYDGGELAGAVFIMQDVTAQREVERTNVKTLQRLESEVALRKAAQEALVQRTQEMEEDLEVAGEFQRATRHPIAQAPYLRTAVEFRPYGAQVSGDVYDVTVNREGSVNILVGDATGHGIAAAFLTLMAQIGLDGQRADLPCGEFLSQLNRTLASRKSGLFLTAAYVRVSADGRLEASSAGHPPVLIFRRDGGDVVELTEGGAPLGIFEEEIAPYTMNREQLQPGDRLIVYSDGITEWKRADGEMFGAERLKELVAGSWERSLEETLAALIEAADSFVGGIACDDDLTVLGFEYNPA